MGTGAVVEEWWTRIVEGEGVCAMQPSCGDWRRGTVILLVHLVEQRGGRGVGSGGVVKREGVEGVGVRKVGDCRVGVDGMIVGMSGSVQWGVVERGEGKVEGVGFGELLLIVEGETCDVGGGNVVLMVQSEDGKVYSKRGVSRRMGSDNFADTMSLPRIQQVTGVGR